MTQDVLCNLLAIPGLTGAALLSNGREPHLYRMTFTPPPEVVGWASLMQEFNPLVEQLPKETETMEFSFSEGHVLWFRLVQKLAFLIFVDDTADLERVYARAEDCRTVFRAEPVDTILAWAPLRINTATLQPVAPPVPPPFSNRLQEASIQEWISAANSLVQCSANFLGKVVVANYLKTSRDELVDNMPLLAKFEVSFAAQISFKGSQNRFNREELNELCQWVQAFVLRCEKVIKDHRRELEGQLTPEQVCLLLQ
ncbi:MAG: hypothetical protein WCA07_03395 [Gloeobacterales cyanobacterium]